MDADQKLQWLLDEGLLFDFELKHEVFRLLEVALAGGGPKVRADLLIRTLQGPPRHDRESTDEDNVAENEELKSKRLAYSIFDHLTWYTKVAPDWVEPGVELEKIRAEHPNFRVSDHPEFTHFMSSGTWGEKLPKSTDEMIEFINNDGANAALEWLLQLDFTERNFDEPDWDSALTLIRNVAGSAPSLGIQLWDSAALSASEPGRAQIQAALMSGWSSSDSPLDWDEVFDRIPSLVTESGNEREIADLLLALFKKGGAAIDVEMVSTARRVADQLWTLHASTFTHHETEDWAMLGLNSWPGTLARFWISEISWTWNQDETAWSGLLPVENNALRNMLTDGSAGARDAAIPMLGSDLYFLFAADSSFVVTELFPLFAAERGAVAQQIWQGYLYRPRVSNRMLELGFIDIIQRGRNLASAEGRHGLADQYFGLVAGICSFTDIDSERRTELVDDVILQGGPAQASTLVRHLARQMSTAKDQEAAGELWDSWIGAFCSNRMAGIPSEPDQDELAAWGEAALAAGTAIPRAIEIVLQRPAPIEDPPSLRAINDDLARLYPEPLLRYVEHVLAVPALPNMLTLHYVREAIRSLARATDVASAEPSIRRVVDAGFPAASGWLDSLEAP
jgi:hypothetical protein